MSIGNRPHHHPTSAKTYFHPVLNIVLITVLCTRLDAYKMYEEKQQSSSSGSKLLYTWLRAPCGDAQTATVGRLMRMNDRLLALYFYNDASSN
jgi:hypothetical protein